MNANTFPGAVVILLATIVEPPPVAAIYGEDSSQYIDLVTAFIDRINQDFWPTSTTRGPIKVLYYHTGHDLIVSYCDAAGNAIEGSKAKTKLYFANDFCTDKECAATIKAIWMKASGQDTPASKNAKVYLQCTDMKAKFGFPQRITNCM